MLKRKDDLLNILSKQNDLLDLILAQQNEIHNCVMNKKWVGLEDSINLINHLSDEFVKLDTTRDVIVSENKDLYHDKDVSDIIFKVRSKLSKSKIENQALATYLNTAKTFVSEVLDECIPHHRSVVYTKDGNIKKPGVSSIVINTVF
jgi:hypothetical protein